MDEPLKSDEPTKTDQPSNEDSSNESLAHVPPRPMIEPFIPASWNVPLLIAAGGAGVLVIAAMLPATCAGATRSAKLQWQERQQQIEQARIAEIDANRHGSPRQ
jgi:hypothetical protein